MRKGRDEGLLTEAAEELSEGGLVEPVAVRSHGHWHRAWKLTRLGLLIILILALIAAAVIWIERKPIANNILAKEMAKRGVQATYHLDSIGLHTQQVSNLVIGDPAHPDLTARIARVQMRIRLNGSVEVYRIAARGVRLNGVVHGRKVSWGQIDKLLPPPSGKPFSLPNIVVDVADTTIRLDTPMGRVGLAVQGAGNLTGGFKGRLAAASHRLTPGRCSLDALKANVLVEVMARKPHIVGPVSADRFVCPSSNITLDTPRMDIDSRFSEAFGEFDGKGRLDVANLIAGANGLAQVHSELSFAGTPTRIVGAIDLAAQRARLAEITADRTRIKGRYRLDATHADLALVGDYAAQAAALGPTLRGKLTRPLNGAKATPIGPIATAMAAAIDRAAGGFYVNGGLRVVNFPGGGAVRIESADATSRSGGRIKVDGGDGITYYWPSTRLRIDGHIQTQGGGLPTADVRLQQPRGGGGMRGEARIAPYAVGTSRLMLAPVRFAAGRGGSTEVHTIAIIDGPFLGGRVAGLRLPVDGHFGGDSGFAFGSGCIDAAFASLSTGSLRLGPSRLPLCPMGPAILYQRPGGSLAAAATTRNLALNGRLGASPFALRAAQAEYVQGDHFALRTMAARLGRPDAPVLIDAAAVRGKVIGNGASGTFTGGKAVIGKVPLNISDAVGDWRFAKGDISATAALTVSDQADPPRFYPLRSDNVRFSLANGRIDTVGTLRHPASGTKVTDVTITHNLGSGRGEALLDVPGIRFGEGLQPEELTRLSQGIIALVQGGVSGQGHIAWDGASVTSTGDFRIADTSLAAPFGPVSGINGTIHFDDLLGLRTAPGQTLTLGSVNPGILVENGVLHYQLLPGQLIKIERGEWPFMGGRLILQETILNFSRPTAKRLTFQVEGLDAHAFVSTMGFTEIKATGVFDGVLPMIFDETGGRIVGGRLDSRPPGGVLEYNGVVSKASLGMFGKIAFDALRHLRYNSMIVRLDGDLAGEFATRLTIDKVALGESTVGNILKSINRIPFKFNVTIKGPFRALIATAKSFRDPRNIIADALPVPLDEVPGIVTEVRRREEETSQVQTPVDQKIDVTTAPEAPKPATPKPKP